MRVEMTGGSPWGFKMTGGRDFRQPLAIGPVKPGSKACRAGVVEGHHILTVNGEDVRSLSHLEAQNKIKGAGTVLVMELSNAPVSMPTVPETGINSYKQEAPTYTQSNQSYAAKPASTYNSSNKPPASYAASKKPTSASYASTNKPTSAYRSQPTSHSHSVSLPAPMSTPRSPTSYSNPHIKTSSYEDQKNSTPDVEHRPVDSRDSQRRMYEDLGPDWAASAQSSTQQSPSMQALLRTSGYTPPSVPDEDKAHLVITSEIKDMILEDEEAKQNGHSAVEGSLRATGARIYEPEQHHRTVSQPAAPTAYTPAYSSTYAPPSNTPAPQATNTKSQAIGNISKFLQTSGAKQGKPVFAKPLQDLQCPYGDPAVLEIRIGNTLPVPTVSWYHNDRPVHESREKDIKFLGRGIVHTLVLGEFSPEFAGRYRCSLTNKHGTTTCSSILSVEQPVNQGGYPTSPSYNNTTRSYQPSYQPTNNYQQQRTVSKPPVASNSVGLYSRNNVSETYAAQTGKKSSKEDPEESEVMRALREQGSVNEKPYIQTRSMRMLEETLMPESDDL